MSSPEKEFPQMQAQTTVERSVEAAVRERLRTIRGYTEGDRKQREHLETEVREAVRLRFEEDDI
jgi:hypothetical protein